MDFSTLKRGQRYFFHYANPHAGNNTFRANYLASVTHNQHLTLIVHKYEGENTGTSPNIHYILSDMIARFDTLIDILEPLGRVSIPEDILLEIDKFW